MNIHTTHHPEVTSMTADVIPIQQCCNNNTLAAGLAHIMAKGADSPFGRTVIARMNELLPRGAGFDNGTRMVMKDSHESRLVFDTEYHHIDSTGHYDGWTSHRITVTPAFDGVHIRVAGNNKNNIRDHIVATFREVLNSPVYPR